MTADEICRGAAVRARLADAIALDAGDDTAALPGLQRLSDLDHAEWVMSIVHAAGFTLLDVRPIRGSGRPARPRQGETAGHRLARLQGSDKGGRPSKAAQP